MPAKLNDRERRAARAMYLADKSCTVDDLAGAYNVSRATMLRVLAGITRPRGGREKPVPTEYIARLRDEGLTYEAIAVRVGLSNAGVQYRLNNANGRKAG